MPPIFVEQKLVFGVWGEGGPEEGVGAGWGVGSGTDSVLRGWLGRGGRSGVTPRDHQQGSGCVYAVCQYEFSPVAKSERRWLMRTKFPSWQNSPLKSSRSKDQTKAPPNLFSFRYLTWIQQHHHRFNLMRSCHWNGTLRGSHDHLCVEAGFVVVPHPIILFDSVWDFLVLNQVDSGPLQKSANLKRESNC